MRFRISAERLTVEIDDESAPPDSEPPQAEARAKYLPLRPVVDTEGEELAEVIELEEVRRG